MCRQIPNYESTHFINKNINNMKYGKCKLIIILQYIYIYKYIYHKSLDVWIYICLSVCFSGCLRAFFCKMYIISNFRFLTHFYITRAETYDKIHVYVGDKNVHKSGPVEQSHSVIAVAYSINCFDTMVY